MKKYLVYMTCAAAAMIGGTGCSDFGDVNMDPEHLNSENIPDRVYCSPTVSIRCWDLIGTYGERLYLCGSMDEPYRIVQLVG